MSELVHNNVETPVEDDVDQGQGYVDQASHNVPTIPSVWPQATFMLPKNPDNSNYWQTLVSKLMKHIPQYPLKTFLKRTK